MTETRPTNAAICDRFRHTLTTGFYVGPQFAPGPDRDQALIDTKTWRGELWKQFREIEDRLCPLRAKGVKWDV